MSMKLNRAAYQELIDGDLTWLEAQPRTLERDHIALIVRRSLEHEYDDACVIAEDARKDLDAARAEVSRRDATINELVAQVTEKDDDRLRLGRERDAARADLARETARCATVCESMVVGGRAWTAAQQCAAEALFAAAAAIRGEPIPAPSRDDLVTAAELARVEGERDALLRLFRLIETAQVHAVAGAPVIWRDQYDERDYRTAADAVRNRDPALAEALDALPDEAAVERATVPR